MSSAAWSDTLASSSKLASVRLPRMLMRLPLYPWLLVLFPIFHLYATNIGAVKDEEFVIVSIGALTASTFIFFVTRAFIGNQYRSALIVSLLALVFTLSGHIHEIALHQEPLLVWSGGILIIAALMVKEASARVAADFLIAPTPWLNLITLLLTLAQIPAIASYHFQDENKFASLLLDLEASPDGQEQPKLPDSDTLPDIYYIIPDGYSSEAWFLEAMNYDNSAFTQALQERGFIVNAHAQNNYASTLLSLASTLNMRYIESNPSQFSDKDYLQRLIADSQVALRLQQLGYTYVQFLSGFLIPSDIADVVRDFTPAGAVDIELLPNRSFALESEAGGALQPIADDSFFYKKSFISLYLETTLLKVIGSSLRSALVNDSTAPYESYAPERFLDALDELDSIVAMPEATFTFVHLLKPHFPTTFDERGNIIPPIKRPKPHQFFAELRFLNAKFLDVIDKLLADSKHEPIINFQSDHSSTYGISTGGSRRVHFDAFSAYYIPDAFALEALRPVTFVNTFPLILNAVFEADLALKDNRLIETIHLDRFEQIDVTETFARWYD